MDAHTNLLEKATEWNSKGRDKSLLLRGGELREAENRQVKSADKEPKPTELMASGSEDHILFWDLKTYQPSGPDLTGHTHNVISLAFSPDGQLLASGGGYGDKTISFGTWPPASLGVRL